MKIKFMVIIILSVLLGKNCLANNLTSIGRYTTIDNSPRSYQTDLLSQIIQVRFTRNILTVGDAVNFLLKYSGYSLLAEPNLNQALKITLGKPLPIVDKEIGPVTLKTALITLIGPAFYLTQDPVNRVIDFKLKPNYLKFVHSKQSIRG